MTSAPAEITGVFKTAMQARTAICQLALLIAMGTSVAETPPLPELAASSPAAESNNTDQLDCASLGRAHAALLNGCFTARRQFEATINQKPALRELVQLDYAAGKLRIREIQREHLNKGIEIGGEGDMVVDSTFSCDQLTRNADGRYELASIEEPERIIFDYDADRDVLLPLRWEFSDKTRFLFRKYHIQAHADYSEFRYEPCETGSDAGAKQDLRD